MTNNATNPLTAPVHELEDIEYNVRMSLDLMMAEIEAGYNDNDELNIARINYIHTLLCEQSQQAAKIYNQLFEAWVSTKPLIEKEAA